jgi:hypothetical protein
MDPIDIQSTLFTIINYLDERMNEDSVGVGRD